MDQTKICPRKCDTKNSLEFWDTQSWQEDLTQFKKKLSSSGFWYSNGPQSDNKSKVGDLSRGWPEGSLFNSYYIEV